MTLMQCQHTTLTQTKGILMIVYVTLDSKFQFTAIIAVSVFADVSRFTLIILCVIMKLNT